MHIGMNFWRSAAAGVAGTALMALSIYLLSFITKKRFKVIRIWGTMLTGRITENKGLSPKPSTFIAGLIAHYKIAISFAAIYAWLWAHNVGAPDLPNAILFGLLNGL